MGGNTKPHQQIGFGKSPIEEDATRSKDKMKPRIRTQEFIYYRTYLKLERRYKEQNAIMVARNRRINTLEQQVLNLIRESGRYK